jgi:NitT/TauT family transport system substrate-binding protein
MRLPLTHRSTIAPRSTASGRYRRRLVATLLLLGLGATTLTACAGDNPQGAVRVGYSAWPGWIPWKITEEKGLFGTPVKLQWFDGYLDSINALNAGQLDCNSQTLNDTISSIAGGADLQVVLTNDNSTGNDQIIVAEGINSVADLKGKRVAAEEGTVDHYLLLLGLEKAGLSADDITFVPLETGAAAAAFVAGQVDAVGVFAPFTTQALRRPGSSTLFSSADFPGAISDHLVCSREFVESNPEKVQELVNAWFATLAEMGANSDASLAILSARAGVSEDEYREYQAGTSLFSLSDNLRAFEPGNSIESLPFAAKEISTFLQQVGLAENPPNLEGLLNDRFVKAAQVD